MSSQNTSRTPTIPAATGDRPTLARPFETVTKERGQGDRRRVSARGRNVSSDLAHRPPQLVRSLGGGGGRVQRSARAVREASGERKYRERKYVLADWETGSG